MVRPRSSPGQGEPGRGQARWDLLLVVAAALILIGVARLHAFYSPLSSIRPALLLSIVGFIALLRNHRGPRSLHLLKSPLGYLMGFIVLWAILTAPFGLYLGNSVRTLTDSFLRTVLVTLLLAASIRNVSDLQRLLKVYALGAIAFALLAQGSGEFRELRGGGYDPNDSAMFIVSGIPLVMHFLFRAQSFVGRLFFGLGLLACASAVVVSGSRGGFLALVAVLGFSLLVLSGLRPIARIAAVAVVLGTVNFQATGEFWERMDSTLDPDDYNRTSYGGRLEIWKRGMGYMLANPVTGVGISNFSVAEGQHPVLVQRIRSGLGAKYSAAHSIWAQVGGELGIPGFLAFVGMFVVAIRLLWRLHRMAPRGSRARGDPDLHALGEASGPLIGVIIGVMVAGSFLSHAYSSLLWAVFGLALAVAKLVILRGRPQATMMTVRSGRTVPLRTRPAAGVRMGEIPGIPRGKGLPVS